MGLVLGPCASVAVHVNTPLLEFKVAFVGTLEAKLNVNAFAGRSGSLAIFVNVRVVSSYIVWLVIAAKVGALFVSRTVIVKVCVALRLGDPLSVTMTLI